VIWIEFPLDLRLCIGTMMVTEANDPLEDEAAFEARLEKMQPDFESDGVPYYSVTRAAKLLGVLPVTLRNLVYREIKPETLPLKRRMEAAVYNPFEVLERGHEDPRKKRCFIPSLAIQYARRLLLKEPLLRAAMRSPAVPPHGAYERHYPWKRDRFKKPSPG
jgi:hypothetical protein